MAKKLVRKVKKVKRKYKKKPKTLKQKQYQKQTVIINIGKSKAGKKRRKTGKKSIPQPPLPQGLSTVLIQPPAGISTSEIKLLAESLRETKPLGRKEDPTPPIKINEKVMDYDDDISELTPLGAGAGSEYDEPLFSSDWTNSGTSSRFERSGTSSGFDRPTRYSRSGTSSGFDRPDRGSSSETSSELTEVTDRRLRRAGLTEGIQTSQPQQGLIESPQQRITFMGRSVD
tara:strand:+ start:62 stop:748 length:687 start_codon:yes stop_codon:yes gene_type:complete